MTLTGVGGRVAAVMTALVAVAACSGDPAHEPAGGTPTDAERARAGGAATVVDTGSGAFAEPIPTLTREERRAFFVGNSFFNDNWVTAPASTEGRDGLGPTFNAQSCSSCHQRDGRAQPPADAEDPERGLLLRLSVPGVDERGVALPVPGFGDQLQDRAVGGVVPEGRIAITIIERPGAFADGTTYSLGAPTYDVADPAFGPLPDDVLVSPRIAPAVFGVGLLEAVPDESLLAAADPDDADGDGISGRPNRVWDARAGTTAIGRFGWKANVATVEQQVAGAFSGDVGITSTIHPDDNCPTVQTACAAAPNGGSPELDDQKLQRVTFYNRTLAVPAARPPDGLTGADGDTLFADTGCTACHTPELTTGESDVEALAGQTIRPYTDLLLHDMGPGLADGRPDFEATGSEWRTPPLWGIGLTATVNGHTRFLHDGRARNLAEAILWHGGEGEAAAESFRTMDAADREALLAFVESL